MKASGSHLHECCNWLAQCTHAHMNTKAFSLAIDCMQGVGASSGAAAWILTSATPATRCRRRPAPTFECNAIGGEESLGTIVQMLHCITGRCILLFPPLQWCSNACSGTQTAHQEAHCLIQVVQRLSRCPEQAHSTALSQHFGACCGAQALSHPMLVAAGITLPGVPVRPSSLLLLPLQPPRHFMGLARLHEHLARKHHADVHSRCWACEDAGRLASPDPASSMPPSRLPALWNGRSGSGCALCGPRALH